MNRVAKSVLKSIFHTVKIEVHRSSIQSSDLRVFGEFIDSKGTKFQLLEGYRHALWPSNWEQMTKNRAVPSLDMIRRDGTVKKGREQVADAARFLDIYGYGFAEKDVLEIGCFDGAACYALAEAGARSVHGFDNPEGFVSSAQPTERETQEQSEWLTAIRSVVRQAYASSTTDGYADKVQLTDDDIREFRGVGKQYDIVVSTNTLEHVLEPAKSFRNMYDALRPGGIALHMYHPFFCPSGAHFDTCDFPWGHVRLSPDDFRRYVREFRPEEIEISEYRFFRTINRLTLSDLRTVASDAGFRVANIYISVADGLFGEDWHDVTRVIYDQCKTNYPTLTLQDLTANRVAVLLEKLER